MILFITTAVKTSNPTYGLHLQRSRTSQAKNQRKSRWQAKCSSETSVDFQRTTRRYIPEERTLHNHRYENLKFYIEELDSIAQQSYQCTKHCVESTQGGMFEKRINVSHRRHGEYERHLTSYLPCHKLKSFSLWSYMEDNESWRGYKQPHNAGLVLKANSQGWPIGPRRIPYLLCEILNR
jgi:hypothetical protein